MQRPYLDSTPATWEALAERTRMTGTRSAMVLLSGGMDSVAAMHIALECYPLDRLAALVVDYGQPHANREITAAQTLASEVGVEAIRINASDAFGPARVADRMLAAKHVEGSHGTSRANVELRNLTLLSLAGMHAGSRFPTGPLDIWIGACRDDWSGFPDTRPEFFAQATLALTYGASRAGGVRVVAPVLYASKVEIVRAALGCGCDGNPLPLSAIARSWSCYRGGMKPCGECSPCVLRNVAFATAGVADLPMSIEPFGGDPHRDSSR